MRRGPSTLSNTANAVTTVGATTDGPGGNSTAPATFRVQTAASQCGLTIAKTSPTQVVRPGDRVTYNVTVRNSGTQAYGQASFTDDLTDVLKDATYNNDQSATAGVVAYSAPVLSWSGALAPSASATITYSVTVRSPDAGDLSMVNAVVSPSPASNCGAGSTDPACTVTVRVDVTDVLWKKVDATAAHNLLSGAEWTLTPVDGNGKPTGAAIAITDCVAGSSSACSGADRDPVAGEFRVSGLGPGTYQLTETRAPAGFLLLKTPITVAVSRTSTTVALADIVNQQVPVPAIPFTGGAGSDLFRFTGGTVLALAVGLGVWQLIRRRRLV
ncbi:SpaA isopeptide-forming pilin-related protein [Leifsonia poae]|uniref:prealbumin-like fold domain-containing protein n=1 Tax=Leifsonia poae TaxID=110933 RepID=UPI003D691717